MDDAGAARRGGRRDQGRRAAPGGPRDSAITDGELRRGSWHMDFVYELDGVTRATDDMHIQFKNPAGVIEFTPAALTVDGRSASARRSSATVRYLQSIVTKGTPKLTIPSPSMVHYRGGRAAVDESVYPDLEQFWPDLGAAYAEEVQRLYDTRLPLPAVRRHEPRVPQRSEAARGDGGEGRGPRPPARDLHPTINPRCEQAGGHGGTTHMCRGNHQSSWVAEGGYDFVAEALFNDLDIDGYFMEWDDERSGDFEPLRFVPKGKTIVLGLVTSKRPELESKDEVKRRIEEASQHVDIDQLCLSPQCGFASTEKGNALTVEQEAAKLRLVIEVAEEVWG